VRPQHSVLFPQERYYRFLLAQDPTAQDPDEPLEQQHRRILRQPPSILFWDNTAPLQIEPIQEILECVPPPAMSQRQGDRNHLRESRDRDSVRRSQEVLYFLIDVQLLQEQAEESGWPLQVRSLRNSACQRLSSAIHPPTVIRIGQRCHRSLNTRVGNTCAIGGVATGRELCSSAFHETSVLGNPQTAA